MNTIIVKLADRLEANSVICFFRYTAFTVSGAITVGRDTCQIPDDHLVVFLNFKSQLGKVIISLGKARKNLHWISACSSEPFLTVWKRQTKTKKSVLETFRLTPIGFESFLSIHRYLFLFENAKSFLFVSASRPHVSDGNATFWKLIYSTMMTSAFSAVHTLRF